MDLAFFMVSGNEDMKVLEMKEKIKGETVKSSEKSNDKEVEETVALMYKPPFLLWLLYLLLLLVIEFFMAKYN